MTSAKEILASLRRALATRKRSIGLLVLYAALRVAVTFTSGDHGLVTPEGRVDLAFGALAATALTLRLAILFLIGPSLVYLLVCVVSGLLRKPPET